MIMAFICTAHGVSWSEYCQHVLFTTDHMSLEAVAHFADNLFISDNDFMEITMNCWPYDHHIFLPEHCESIIIMTCATLSYNLDKLNKIIFSNKSVFALQKHPCEMVCSTLMLSYPWGLSENLVHFMLWISLPHRIGGGGGGVCFPR